MKRSTDDILLIEKSRVRRSFRLILDGEERYLEYRGDGMGYESVHLDGYEVMQATGAFKMVPEFEFEVDSHSVRFEIDSGFWLSLLGPLSPVGLKRFAVYVDDQCIYEERNGRPLIEPLSEN